MQTFIEKFIVNKIVRSIVLGSVIVAAGTILVVRNTSTFNAPGLVTTTAEPSTSSLGAIPSGNQIATSETGIATQLVPIGQPSSELASDHPTNTPTPAILSTSSSFQSSPAIQPKTINDVAVDLKEKQSGYCRALAPSDWSFTTNAEATGADLFAPNLTMHAGWGIAGVYAALYPDVDNFLNVWMPLAGYTGIQLQSPEPLEEGFVKRDFTSGIGKRGFLIYKTYQFDPTVYVVSVYFAAADNELWPTQGALPAYAAISIRCVSQLRPTTSSVDVSRSNPSNKSDNPEVSLSDKWTEAIMGYENVYSSSTGNHYEAPLNSRWETGPEGSGYYRGLPDGGYEKLTPGFGSY